MSETKWTPGPWEMRQWTGEDWPEQRISVDAVNGGHCVAISPRYRWNLDDFSLIAAAPELYEALHHIVESTDFELDRQLEMATAALKKARGES